MERRIAIAGAGLSGAVIAHKLAYAGCLVDVFEKREHLGGNCFTYRDSETGVLVHKYGPHIFHTDNQNVWDFITGLAEFVPFTNRVKAQFNSSVYSLPVNLLTINQLYGVCLGPKEAEELVTSEADLTIDEPKNFEEQALRFMGERIYKAFFYGYTRKQWGCEPSRLPANILKRLPIRFNYDDNYFCHPYQGMPRDGYTPIFEKLLDHPNISVHLGTVLPSSWKDEYEHAFYSGTLDGYFDYEYGGLGYRSLRFEQEIYDGDFQGCAVMNYCDYEVPFTRITEHKHFSPWEQHDKSVIFKEYSFAAQRADEPFYPLRLADDKTNLKQYVERANKEENVTFVGRLGTYRYLDMDKTIAEALATADCYADCVRGGRAMPAFVFSPA